MRVVQYRLLAGGLAVDEPVGALRIKAFNPISNNLRSDAAGLRRLGPARPIIDTRKREKTPCLGSVPRMLRQTPKRPRVEISAQWNCQRHGEPPSTDGGAQRQTLTVPNAR